MRMPQSPPETSFDGLVSAEMLDTAIRFNSAYLHWDEVRRRTDLSGTELWNVMKLLRSNSMRPLRIGDINLRYTMTEDIHRMLHIIDTASPPFAGRKDAKRYAVSSAMEESIASSQVEGATTTARIAKMMLREGRRPKDMSERMIFNNYRVMAFIKDRSDDDITPDLIKKMHELIVEDILDIDHSGSYRDADDIVVSDIEGNVFHEPPPYADVPELMDRLCDHMNDNEYVHPVVKAIIIHFAIAYIHPFTDGNGRLARALMYWYALKNGYNQFEYLAISKTIRMHRSGYDMAYLHAETDGNDMTYFIKYILKRIIESMDLFNEYVKKKSKEMGVMNISQTDGLNLRQRSILNDSKEGIPFSIVEMKAAYQTSYQTARTDIMLLESKGLVKKCGKEWNRILYVIAD